MIKREREATVCFEEIQKFPDRMRAEVCVQLSEKESRITLTPPLWSRLLLLAHKSERVTYIFHCNSHVFRLDALEERQGRARQQQSLKSSLVITYIGIYAQTKNQTN